MAKILITVGLILVLLGIIWQFAPGLLNWFGRLPGDIHIKKAHGEVFIPVTSMLVVSVVISLVLWFFRR